MNAYYKGQLLCGPRGPAGPDGNPVGTVISFLGLTAPKDYLICDGAEYHIADYPELAGFFRQQFGAANHFGGDGAASFAVPDMRNLFLRGYHGESQEPLSGDVGEKQEATRIPNIYVAAYGKGFFVGKNPSLDGNWPDYADTTGPIQSTYSETSATVHSGPVAAQYTSRPVNMAVLFCIKAAESVPTENVYSTEETRIGTWIDGKSLYRRVLCDICPNADTWTAFPNATISDIAELTCVNMMCFYNAGGLVWTNVSPFVEIAINPYSTVVVLSHSTNLFGKTVSLTIEYTKTTDGKE